MRQQYFETSKFSLSVGTWDGQDFFERITFLSQCRLKIIMQNTVQTVLGSWKSKTVEFCLYRIVLK